jgi:hypothetical protein
MANKKLVQKKTNSGLTPGDKKIKGNAIPQKVAEEQQKKPLKKSSALIAASMARSAVDAVNANSSKDVRGSSGLANTGTIISYD